jgi:uncharacterized metal-binding protein
MPSGRIHDRITLWSLPWIVGLTLLFVRDGEITLIVASAFLFSGLMFGPDLDIYSVQFKRWGKLKWIWLPYQNLLTHRSCLSHGPILGTSLRIIYLLCLLTIVAVLSIAIAQLIWGFDWNWQQFTLFVVPSTISDKATEAIALFVGLELGAASHFLSDFTASIHKRHRKKLMLKKKKPKNKRGRRE